MNEINLVQTYPPPYYGFNYQVVKENGEPIDIDGVQIVMSDDGRSFVITAVIDDMYCLTVFDCYENKKLFSCVMGDYSIQIVALFEDCIYLSKSNSVWKINFHASHRENGSVIFRDTLSINNRYYNSLIDFEMSCDKRFITIFGGNFLHIWDRWSEEDEFSTHEFVGDDRSDDNFITHTISKNNIEIILFSTCVVFYNLETGIYQIFYSFSGRSRHHHETTISIRDNNLHHLIIGYDGQIALSNEYDKNVIIKPFSDEENIICDDQILFFYKNGFVKRDLLGSLYYCSTIEVDASHRRIGGASIDTNDNSIEIYLPGDKLFAWNRIVMSYNDVEMNGANDLYVINFQSYLKGIE